MSYTQIEELMCPFCGKNFVAELWGTVNVSTDPDLKEALLGGVLNVQNCPSCGNIFYAERFVLYHDPASELMAFVYPAGLSPEKGDLAGFEAWSARMMKDFEEAQNDLEEKDKIRYQPELFFGLESLCELIRCEEELEDEVKVVEDICRRRGIKTLHLARSRARSQGKKYLSVSPVYSDGKESAAIMVLLPRVIPVNVDKDSCLRREFTIEKVRQAIEMAIDGNDAFIYYRRFLEALKDMDDKYFEKIIAPDFL